MILKQLLEVDSVINQINESMYPKSVKVALLEEAESLLPPNIRCHSERLQTCRAAISVRIKELIDAHSVGADNRGGKGNRKSGKGSDASRGSGQEDRKQA